MLYMGDALTTGDTNRFVDEMAGFAAAGIEEVIVMPSGPDPIAFVERAATVIPALTAI